MTTNEINRLTDVVGHDLDQSTDGATLAEQTNYSRFYFQRRFRQMTGETPGACRRRLRLERAGYQLCHSTLTVTEIAFDAGFESLEGFSRAFRKGYGSSPSQFRRAQPLSWYLATPNDIHYDPVVGGALRLANQQHLGGSMDLIDRLLGHDQWATQLILEEAAKLTDEQLDAPLAKPDHPLHFEKPDMTLRELLDSIVFTKEIWVAAVQGQPGPTDPDKSPAGLLQRMQSSYSEFVEIARRVRDEDLWTTEFVDMICEPPETFLYGGMISHVINLSCHRRYVAVEALGSFGHKIPADGDPIHWESLQLTRS